VDLVNYKTTTPKAGDNLLDRIDEPFHSEIGNINSEFQNFSQIIELEEKFLIDQIEKDKGIGDNRLLRENIFLLFVSLNSNIPLIIIGKPGSGKSLSVQLICKTMKGTNSSSKFFKQFPSILQSYFQGSRSTTPEDVEGIFQIAEERLNSLIKNNEKSLPISMILFDELGLADKSKYNPLKVLHNKLEPNNDITIKQNKSKVSFVGISNWTLDAAKINRALTLSVPDLDESLDDLIKTSESIAESIDSTLANDEIFTNIIPIVYNEYKTFLKDLKDLEVYSFYELNEFNNDIKHKLQEKDYFDFGKHIISLR